MNITQDSFNILYKTYIRPHVEYCIQAWNSYYAKYIDIATREDSPPRYRTCLIYPTKNRSRFSSFILFTVGGMQHGDLMESFKILKQYLNIDSTEFLTLSTSNLRGHDYKLFKPQSHLLIRSEFFTHWVIDLWNSLPPRVINSQLVDAFKNNLDDYWTVTGYGHIRGQWPIDLLLILIALLSIKYNNNNNEGLEELLQLACVINNTKALEEI